MFTDYDNPLNKQKQELADRDLERRAMLEAQDMFSQYMEQKIEWEHKIAFQPELAKYWKFYPIVIPRPEACFIYVYPQQESKYDSKSYVMLRDRYYKELINSYNG